MKRYRWFKDEFWYGWFDVYANTLEEARAALLLVLRKDPEWVKVHPVETHTTITKAPDEVIEIYPGLVVEEEGDG